MTVSGLFVKFQRWWLGALLVLMPVSVTYLIREPVGVTPLNLLSAGFIGLGIINLLLGGLSLKKNEPRSLWIVILLLVIAFSYALIYTNPLSNALGFWVSRFIQPLLVGFFIYQMIRNDAVSVTFCMRALLFSVLALLVVVILQVQGGVPYVDSGRISAFYTSANGLARYLAFVLLVTLPWLMFAHPKNKSALWIVWGLGLVMLIPTFSYGGVLTFGVGFVALFLCLPSPYARLKAIVLGLTALLFLVVAINAPRLPNWQIKINESRLSRLEFWDIASHTIQDNLWTGIGIKGWETQYVTLVQKYKTSQPLNWVSTQPHNNYLDAFLKAGVIGFIAIMGLVFWPVVQGAKIIKSFYAKHELWWVGVSVFVYGVAIVTLGLIDDPLWSDDVALFLWVVLFMGASVIASLRQQE